MSKPFPRGLAAYPITPADREGRVDVPALRRLLTRLREAGVDAVGLLGSTGTYAYLSRAERRRAIEAAAETLGGACTLLVGIGALRTDEAAALGRDAREAGADAVLLAPVSYTPLTEDEVFDHYVAVAEAAGLPVCVYDNPATTHFRFEIGLFARLAGVAGVAAIKTGAPPPAEVAARHAGLRAALPASLSLGYSVDANAAGAMLAGGDLWHSVLGGIAPGPCLAIARAAARGDGETVARENARLQPVWALFGDFSSLRVSYAIAAALGLCDAAPPLPIQALPKTARARVDAVCEELAL